MKILKYRRSRTRFKLPCISICPLTFRQFCSPVGLYSPQIPGFFHALAQAAGEQVAHLKPGSGGSWQLDLLCSVGPHICSCAPGSSQVIAVDSAAAAAALCVTVACPPFHSCPARELPQRSHPDLHFPHSLLLSKISCSFRVNDHHRAGPAQAFP